MNAHEASIERERIWDALKPLLLRTLGSEGAARWLEFAAKEIRIRAKRDVIKLAPADPIAAEFSR